MSSSATRCTPVPSEPKNLPLIAMFIFDIMF
jgi:hypothetical protein